jgi:NtrC-family two-component system response regulator AlgB
LPPPVLAVLTAYPWKGNIRELENVMERAVILSKGETIQLYHLPEEFQNLANPATRPLSLEEIEQQHIISVLRIAKDLDEAASMLGIDPATLWRKRKKFNL